MNVYKIFGFYIVAEDKDDALKSYNDSSGEMASSENIGYVCWLDYVTDDALQTLRSMK